MKIKTFIIGGLCVLTISSALAAGCDPQAAEIKTKEVTTAAAPAAPPPKAATKPKPEPKPSAPLETASEANARQSAEDYLKISAFSRSGLIKQLTFEGYPAKDAAYGVDANHINYNVQAAKSAKSYLELTTFSHSGLVQQLEFEGFTPSQAEYGVSQAGL